MKSTIVMLSLVFSVNAFASTLAPTIWTSVTAGIAGVVVTSNAKVQSLAVLNDAQEMLNTGRTSLFLSQKIQETQDLNEDLSEVEALDILIESAQNILAQ